MKDQYLLVINCGSSSLKFAVYNTRNELRAEGLAEKLSVNEAELHISIGDQKTSISLGEPGHELAITTLASQLETHFSLSDTLIGIGHRVVHGGESFKASTLITPDVIEEIKACIPLAPLHNPANLLGIELMQQAFPALPQVAVFDTAFHQTMPNTAFLYAIPYSFYTDQSIRRYGFHGTSHRYVCKQAASLLSKAQDKVNLITAHLGNGASVCAIKDGESVDTSMGFTPLEGLVMGTRSGDLDPGIYDYLLSKGYKADEITQILNKKSGLLGLSNESNDMRRLGELAEDGHEQAKIAIDVFVFRLAKYIAAMMTSLEQLDALIFTGGIGENAANIRSRTIDRLAILGFRLDDTLNQNARNAGDGFIHRDGSRPIMVISTNEELMIAQDTLTLI